VLLLELPDLKTSIVVITGPVDDQKQWSAIWLPDATDFIQTRGRSGKAVGRLRKNALQPLSQQGIRLDQES
jgi:hypothetical protein